MIRRSTPARCLPAPALEQGYRDVMPRTSSPPTGSKIDKIRKLQGPTQAKQTTSSSIDKVPGGKGTK